MTPDDLIERLATMPAETPLVFTTDEGDIRGGYHVTELKLADIRSIDCGARQSTWQELLLQLLDGSGGDHMSVGKFAGILSQSAQHVDGLGQTPMQVEFAPANSGIRIYQLSEPHLDGGRVTIDLVEIRASCKPMRDAAIGRPSECCSSGSSTKSGCCDGTAPSVEPCCA